MLEELLVPFLYSCCGVLEIDWLTIHIKLDIAGQARRHMAVLVFFIIRN